MLKLCTNNLGDAQKLMKLLEELCTRAKLSVNGSKTKIMLLKSKKNDKLCITTIMRHLNVWKASNILALKFLQIVDRNMLHAAQRREREHIMHLRTYAIIEILSVGFSRNTFSTLVIPVLLYGVEL